MGNPSKNFYDHLINTPFFNNLTEDERKEVALRILHGLNGDHPMTEQFKAVCSSLAFNPERL